MLLQYYEFHAHILHDSLLGVNAYCCMIGTIAPEDSHRWNIMSTLKMAQRNMKIVNTVNLNVDKSTTVSECKRN